MQTQLHQEPENLTVSPGELRPAHSTGRLRVLHVLSCLGLGGTEHGVLKIIRGLGDDEFEHQICAVRGIDESFAHQMKIEAKMSAVGTREPGFQFPLFRLARLMKQFRPHVVHTRNFGALEAIPAARMTRVPVAIHSEHGYELETLKGLPLRRRIVCSAFYALADQVFTVTEDLRDYYSRQAWLSPKRFRVIYNGVNTDLFRPRPEILVRQGRDVQVLLVGSGPELPKLREEAAASPELAGRILFLGASDGIPDLLNAMDVFVLPSISEGMSNTILEAMATGLPPVVTRAGGNPELVEDGRVGCLFNPGDVQALAGLLSRLADETVLRRRYGQAARQRAVEHFSLAVMMRHYRDLYLDL